LKEMT